MINPFKNKYEGNLDSTYIPQYAFGTPTSPQTANQIAEATARLNAGVFGVDLALIDERLFEQIPKQHFKEIDRLMKVTGAKATIHGPIVDLAGFSAGEGGARWDEDNRIQTERKLKYYLDMAHETDAKGNTPINFHINTGLPGETWEKMDEERLRKEYNLTNKDLERLGRMEKDFIKESYNPRTGKKEYEVMRNVLAVDRETGQILPLKLEAKQYPGGPKLWTPTERLKNINQTQWDQEKLKVFEYQRQKMQILDRIERINQEIRPYIYGAQKSILSKEEEIFLQEKQKEKERLNSHIYELDTHINTNLNEIFNELKYAPKEIKPQVDHLVREIQKEYLNKLEEIKPLAHKIYEIENRALSGEKLNQRQLEEYQNLKEKLRILHDKQTRELQLALDKAPAPEKFIPANNLAKEKTAETVSNVLFESWKKYKDNTPIILLENYLPEGLIGSAEDLGKTVEESRKKFAEKLMKEKNYSKDEASKIAEKLIGVTWDVGHINFLRRYGYDEEKIKEETKKIAPYVKQVHITDNFGFNDAHLPPGMGNAPIKEEMEIIAKEMKKKGLEFKKGSVIVEAGAYVAQFKESPHPQTLEYFESPLYTYKAQPYWKDIWETEAPYWTGGIIFPEQHFQMYGTGFSNLPAELGGPITQDKSRFAGTPNA